MTVQDKNAELRDQHAHPSSLTGSVSQKRIDRMVKAGRSSGTPFWQQCLMGLALVAGLAVIGLLAG